MTRGQDDTVGEFNFMTAMSACFSRLSLADAEFILHRGIRQQDHKMTTQLARAAFRAHGGSIMTLGEN